MLHVKESIAPILLVVTALVFLQKLMVMSGKKPIASAVVITKNITNKIC